MNKKDFVNLVKDTAGYESKAEAQKAVDVVINSIEKALCKKEDVSFLGFGTFTVQFQQGRSGKIPGTDKEYTVKERFVPKFKPGKVLKEKVKNIK